jgi:hypothetical protein
MSLQLPETAKHSVLASILSDIGASQFLPNFIEAQQDDSDIRSFKVAKAVEKSYGLPLDLAENFVEKCRAVAARSAEPAGIASSSNSIFTDGIGPFLFPFFFILSAAFCFLFNA